MRRLILAFVALGVASCTSTEVPERSQLNPPVIGVTDGCSAAYWREPTHFGSWEEYGPSQLVNSVFSNAGQYGDTTLAEALDLGDAPTGSARDSLMREAVAGLLNAAHDSLEYPYRRYDPGIGERPGLVPHTNNLLARGSPAEIQTFLTGLTAANGLDCPLDQE